MMVRKQRHSRQPSAISRRPPAVVGAFLPPTSYPLPTTSTTIHICLTILSNGTRNPRPAEEIVSILISLDPDSTLAKHDIAEVAFGVPDVMCECTGKCGTGTHCCIPISMISGCYETIRGGPSSVVCTATDGKDAVSIASFPIKECPEAIPESGKYETTTVRDNCPDVIFTRNFNHDPHVPGGTTCDTETTNTFDGVANCVTAKFSNSDGNTVSITSPDKIALNGNKKTMTLTDEVEVLEHTASAKDRKVISNSCALNFISRMFEIFNSYITIAVIDILVAIESPGTCTALA